VSMFISADKRFLIRLILFPLLSLVPGGSVLNNLLIPLGLSIWAYSQFYHKESQWTIIKRAFWGMLLFIYWMLCVEYPVDNHGEYQLVLSIIRRISPQLVQLQKNIMCNGNIGQVKINLVSVYWLSLAYI
jgi:hypothetical protein